MAVAIDAEQRPGPVRVDDPDHPHRVALDVGVGRPLDPETVVQRLADDAEAEIIRPIGVSLRLWHHPFLGPGRRAVETDLEQQALADAVLALGKPVATVIFAGRPLTIGALADRAPAILWAWHPGVEAGPALADLLFGDVSPSGRLPISFPRHVGQIPIHYDHRSTGRPPSETERNSAKYVDAPWTPLYPFGHGLTYAPVRYEALTLSSERVAPGAALDVAFRIANEGRFAVEEVVQLYLHDEVASTTRPVKALKRFARIALAPGERKQVRFTLAAADFALLDVGLAPVVEPGGFSLFVGGSSETALEAYFTVES